MCKPSAQPWHPSAQWHTVATQWCATCCLGSLPDSGSTWADIVGCGGTGIAVSCGSLVGLDVEESGRHTKADPLKLARRRLAPPELAQLEGVCCSWFVHVQCMFDVPRYSYCLEQCATLPTHGVLHVPCSCFNSSRVSYTMHLMTVANFGSQLCQAACRRLADALIADTETSMSQLLCSN